MEKLKNNSQLEPNDTYNQGCAFGIIALMFLLLTLVTSYQTLTVLPIPMVFYFGSMILGVAIFVFFCILAAIWENKEFLLAITFVSAVCLVCAAFVFRENMFIAGVLGGYVFWIPYYFLRYIPSIIFPFLFISTFVIGIIYEQRGKVIKRSTMRSITYLTILFTGVFTWGHANSFEGNRYDEGLIVDGTSYHAIVLYGWLGDPGLVFLHECHIGIIGCELIYYTDTYKDYRADETRLVFDEASHILRLEYHLPEYEVPYIPPILYEHPLQQK